MRNASLVLVCIVLVGCQSLQSPDTSMSGSPQTAQCLAHVPPPTTAIAPATVVINGTTVTPTLAKELFLRELGDPCRVAKGTPGTQMSDDYLYDRSLGLRFHTRPGLQSVTEVSFWFEHTSWTRKFDGKRLMFGKDLPLDSVRSIQRALPELGLDFDNSVPLSTAKVFGLYAGRIGDWKLGVRVDDKTGVVTSVYVAFRSIVCSNTQISDCFDGANGQWRAP